MDQKVKLCNKLWEIMNSILRGKYINFGVFELLRFTVSVVVLRLSWNLYPVPSFSHLSRGSRYRLNRLHESTSPCKTPLRMSNASVVKLSPTIRVCALAYKDSTICMNSSGILSNRSVSRSLLWGTLGYAALKSMNNTWRSV